MELRYADNELERQCTDARYMQRKLGAQRAKALKLRLNELRQVEKMSDLLLLAGKWDSKTADRAGQWAGRLTGNWRVVVRPLSETAAVVEILEIVDYH